MTRKSEAYYPQGLLISPVTSVNRRLLSAKLVHCCCGCLIRYSVEQMAIASTAKMTGGGKKGGLTACHVNTMPAYVRYGTASLSLLYTVTTIHICRTTHKVIVRTTKKHSVQHHRTAPDFGMQVARTRRHPNNLSMLGPPHRPGILGKCCARVRTLSRSRGE